MSISIATEPSHHRCMSCQQSLMASWKSCLCGTIYYCSNDCQNILEKAIGKHRCCSASVKSEISGQEWEQGWEQDLDQGWIQEELNEEGIPSYETIWKAQYDNL